MVELGATATAAGAIIVFLRTFSTIRAPCAAGTGGGLAPTASERCLACVRDLTSFVSVMLSCSAREIA